MTTSLSIGQTVPDFTLPATGDKNISLQDYRGKYLLLYFYPKDNTPGCILEGQAFRDNIDAFNDLNCAILGVSMDTVAKHEKFKCKQKFPFDLLADTESQLCQAFGVLKTKKLFGHEFEGIERSSFLINPDGVIIYAWRKVKIKQHVAEVLEQLHNTRA